MKTRLLLAVAGMAIGLPLPALAQEKEEATPFLYRAILASPQIAQQLDATNSQFDEAINKHDAVAVAALFTANETLVVPEGEGHGPKLTPPDVVWIMRDVSAQTPAGVSAKAKKVAQLRAAISIAAI
jgi:hypothetical protein